MYKNSRFLFKHFYRAMLCIARSMLSICPTVTRRYSIETLKRIIDTFSTVA